MPLLNDIAYRMRKFPMLKRCLKTIYQYIGNFISDKKTFPKDINQISNDQDEHLFGYYDKCPWNENEDKMIYLQVSDAYKDVAPKKEAKIILKDLNSNEEKVIATTKAWNVQQGCMLQWLGPEYNSEILYNDFIDNELKTVILNIQTNEKRIIDFPVYTVDKSGKWGLTLDFYRLHRMRPGYGYSNKADIHELINIATIYSNIKYRNDCRCDLHPRWNRSGNKICFDGAQKSKRQIYVIDVGDKL